MEAFLQRQIKFTQIPQIIEQVLTDLPTNNDDTLEQILADDKQARRIATALIK